jgi:hypothetical protein
MSQMRHARRAATTRGQILSNTRTVQHQLRNGAFFSINIIAFVALLYECD